MPKKNVPLKEYLPKQETVELAYLQTTIKKDTRDKFKKIANKEKVSMQVLITALVQKFVDDYEL